MVSVASAPSATDTIFVDGYNTLNDGGGGIFMYRTSLRPSSENRGTIFFPTTIGINGWYERIFSVPINVRWFDVFPSNSALDNQTNFQRCIDFVAITGGKIFIPSGEYHIDENLILKQGVTIEGEVQSSQSLFNRSNKKGTILVFDNTTQNANCIDFEVRSFGSGIINLSVYINNNNPINAVISIVGVLYPILNKVEIGSTTVSPGCGLFLSSIGPNPTNGAMETLYGSFTDVNVSLNDPEDIHEGSLSIALKIVGGFFQSMSSYFPLVVNANTFTSCHFHAKNIALQVDEIVANNKKFYNQSLTFLGCSFEVSYYTGYISANSPIVVSNFNNLHGSASIPGDWLVFPWIQIDSTRVGSFQGCYFEFSGFPSSLTFNNIIYPSERIIGAIYLGLETISISLENSTIYSALLDYGNANSAQFLPNGYKYCTYEMPRLIQTKNNINNQAINAYSYENVSFQKTPSSEDYKENVIGLQNFEDVLIKERGTYVFQSLVTFYQDFPSGSGQFCQMRIKVFSSGGVQYIYGPIKYGSGSTQNTITAEICCLATMNRGDMAQVQVIQNTGSIQSLTPDASNNYLEIYKI